MSRGQPGALYTLQKEDFETIPKVQNGMRACMVCSLLKNVEQFEVNGCDNCNQVLGDYRNNRDRVYRERFKW